MLWEFFRLYPTPELAVKADPRDLASLLNPLGLHEKRAQIIIKCTGKSDPRLGFQFSVLESSMYRVIVCSAIQSSTWAWTGNTL